MISAENEKEVLMVPPQLKDNGAFANNTPVDTLGYKFLAVKIYTGALDTTIGSTSASAALKLEACETIDGIYTDVDEGALADAIAADEDNKIFRFDLDLIAAPQKRYIRLNAPTAGDGTTGAYMCAVGVLSKFQYVSPDDNAERGVEELVKVN